MGHWCRICDTIKPNEKFSGKGHKNHICKKCATKPKEEIDTIDRQAEICGFLKQTHISTKNIRRLQKLSASENEEIAKMASIVLDVAKVTPYKKNRIKSLARERKELLEKLETTGLIFSTW